MRNHFFLALLLVLVIGCQDIDRPEKPDNLISKKVMVDILTDVYIANAARSVNNKAIRDKGIKLDSVIYQRYNIDSVQFAKSNAWYTSNLNTYNDLFQQVQDRLEVLKKKADSIVKSDTSEELEEELDTLAENMSQLGESIEFDMMDQDSLQ